VAAKLQLLNRLFPKLCAFMLSILEVWIQVAASHWKLSCNKLAKCQTSVLTDDSGDGRRQLQQGGGGGTHSFGCGECCGCASGGYMAISVWSCVLNFVILFDIFCIIRAYSYSSVFVIGLFV
jgi:hypothetical protein